MTEQDRELLETAAKAAGYEIEEWDAWGFAQTKEQERWNPLVDDGDALRLAVKMDMLVGIGECDCCAEAHYQGGEEPIRVRFSSDFPDCEAPDAFSATRLAIVRAAAEIGRNMA